MVKTASYSFSIDVTVSYRITTSNAYIDNKHVAYITPLRTLC